MKKLVLMSLIIALMAVPIRFASDQNPRRGLKRALSLLAAYDVLYVILLKYVYPHL